MQGVMMFLKSMGVDPEAMRASAQKMIDDVRDQFALHTSQISSLFVKTEGHAMQLIRQSKRITDLETERFDLIEKYEHRLMRLEQTLGLDPDGAAEPAQPTVIGQASNGNGLIPWDATITTETL